MEEVIEEVVEEVVDLSAFLSERGMLDKYRAYLSFQVSSMYEKRLDLLFVMSSARRVSYTFMAGITRP